jgi:PhnB protein
MIIQPYVCYNGQCDEAHELYKKVLGAQVSFVLRYKEGPPEACAPGNIPANWENKVMHSEVKIGESTVMMTDGNSDEPAKFDGIMLTVQVPDEAEAQRVFGGLGDGGQTIMPLAETFFSPCFGMTTDKFGVTWMVIVPKAM